MTRMLGTGSVALAILFASSSASAQTDIEKIRASVKPGQKVLITDDAGQEVKGRIAAMTAGELIVLADGKSAEVPYGRIVRIDRPNDSLANGALIGLGVGAGLGFTLAVEDVRCEQDCLKLGTGFQVGSALVLGGLGTAVGVGIDALIHRDREIYRRGGGAVASVAPVVGRGVRGAVVSVTWYVETWQKAGNVVLTSRFSTTEKPPSRALYRRRPYSPGPT